MKKFGILISLIFLICINKINSFNDLSDCPEGKYGPNCEQECECNLWSSSKNCSKIQGRCLDCKFGHFGVNCNQICDPRCKTNLCCALYSKKDDTNLVINGNISIITVKINNKPENISLNIVADYNVGYPLAIFNKTLKEELSPFNKETIVTKSCYYTKYGNITGGLYENVSISINDKQIEMNLPVILVVNDDIKVEEGINGVIGLGFLNSINENLLSENKISENIVSYELDDKGDKISIIFGNLFKDGKRYVHKLSYCNAISNQRSELSMKCKVDAIGTKKYSDALEIKDTYITFSLNDESSFVLKKNDNYIKYIESYYLRESYIKQDKDESDTIYYCFEKDKINKLNNFGFVMNKYYYYYQADVFFSSDDQVNKEKCGDSNKYAKFMIEFTDNDEKIGIIFGKSFYSRTQFTIDNEERKIYLYTRNAEYFLGETKTEFTSTPGLSISPMTTSFIIAGIAFFLNALSFLIYFLCKRKKQQKIE